ncbi:SH3 domain-containing protein [Bacteroides congonensis]|jgi:uncharacterized protein YgiM (DUF1202 family)
MKMKKLISVSLILLTCMSFVCKAQSLPKFLVAVTKPNVNVRQAPNSSATVVTKAPLGTVFEMVSKQTGWYEVKEALTGKKGYISASVSKLCPDTDPYYPRTTDDIVDITEFENISKRQNSETTVTYGFRSKDKMKTNIIYASLSTTTADTSGRMRSYENYYKGKQMGWYIVLDEETDYEGTVQSKLDKPILVFRESSGKAGIYIQGIYYKDANNPFE